MTQKARFVEIVSLSEDTRLTISTGLVENSSMKISEMYHNTVYITSGHGISAQVGSQIVVNKLPKRDLTVVKSVKYNGPAYNVKIKDKTGNVIDDLVLGPVTILERIDANYHLRTVDTLCGRESEVATFDIEGNISPRCAFIDKSLSPGNMLSMKYRNSPTTNDLYYSHTVVCGQMLLVSLRSTVSSFSAHTESQQIKLSQHSDRVALPPGLPIPSNPHPVIVPSPPTIRRYACIFGETIVPSASIE